ncbi:AAA family ATPase [Hyphomonas jannaschiana]|nr:AAA family ATPase [Hyphomonas jannaschiana]
MKFKAHDVFTPRSPEVNADMYIRRVVQEYALVTNLSTNKHLLIHGESGSGKSWLYKHVFSQEGVPFTAVNMAVAARFNDVNAALADKFASIKTEVVRKVTSKGGGKGSIGFLSVSAEEIEEIERLRKEPFEQLLEAVADKDGKPSFLVFENMEAILGNQKLVNQVSDILILLDDDDYAKYNVRILIVGVPNDMQSYFSQTKNAQTISNRIVEIPEVARLEESDAVELLRKGLVEQLGLQPTGVTLEKIAEYTDYIPQYIHELGLNLAIAVELKAEDKEKITESDLKFAVGDWISSSFTSDHTAMLSKMNSKSTKVGRRNQVIFAMSQFEKGDFSYRDVETEVRRLFPNTTDQKTLNVSQILSELAADPHPIIRKSPRGDTYRFVSPKMKICIRGSLLESGEKIERLDLLIADLKKRRRDAQP